MHTPEYREGQNSYSTHYVDNIYNSYGLDDIVSSYPFVKKYSRIFSGLLDQGVDNFYVYGEGNNAVIIMADNKKDTGGFVIKIPKKQDYNIGREYLNHNAFSDMLYRGYQSNDPMLKKVIIPQINSLSSQNDAVIVMDRLPGKSVKRVLLEYFFRPLFNNPRYMKYFELTDVSNDMEIIEVLQNDIQQQIKHGEIQRDNIIISRYQGKNIKYIIDTYIGLRGIDDRVHLTILQEAIGEKTGQEVWDIVHYFVSYSESNGCKHTDLNNAGNIYIMGSPSHRQVGIIDFGNAEVSFTH